MRNNLQNGTLENAKEYYYDVFGTYPPTNYTKEKIIDRIFKDETLVNIISDDTIKINYEVTAANILDQLDNCKTREDAKEILSALKLRQLKDIAREFGIKATNKQSYITKIVSFTVGDRLDREAIDSFELNTQFNFK